MSLLLVASARVAFEAVEDRVEILTLLGVVVLPAPIYAESRCVTRWDGMLRQHVTTCDDGRVIREQPDWPSGGKKIIIEEPPAGGGWPPATRTCRQKWDAFPRGYVTVCE